MMQWWCYKTMFFEDINSIYEKYKYLSFWYRLSYDDLKNNAGNYVDFFKISQEGTYGRSCEIHNSFYSRNYREGGEALSDNYIIAYFSVDGRTIATSYLFEGQYIEFLIYIDTDYIPPSVILSETFICLTPLVFIRNNTKGWGRKIYIDFTDEFIDELKVGSLHYNEQGEWVISQTTKTVQEDDIGYYVTPHYTNTLNEIFYISDGDDTYYLGKIILVPQLPIITNNPLYKDGKQHIQLYFDGNIIDDKYYSIIYKNEVLKNNIIDISEDINQIDIKIKLNHPEYIKTTLDYSIPVDYFVISSISDINTAKQKGIRTIVNNTQRTLETLSLSNIKLISNAVIVVDNLNCENAIIVSDDIRAMNIYLKDSSLKTGLITPYQSGFSNITCISSNISDTFLRRCKIKAYGDCIYENNTFNKCLIISDSDNITIINNTFNDVFEYADYFPNSLYLTGNFKCQGNTFNQEKTFAEFDFNVALLKTINETDINNFINSNTFNLNNTVNDTVYTGLFYNLVDDDDVIYKEVE